MFFDIGWPEFMLIGVVALVVIGPKDLPAALRVAGYWVRKARTLSREFHSSVEQMIREAELHEVQEELRKATEIKLDSEPPKMITAPGDPPAAREIPDHLDTTPAPADPEPPIIGFETAADEPPPPAAPPEGPPAAEAAHVAAPTKS